MLRVWIFTLKGKSVRSNFLVTSVVSHFGPLPYWMLTREKNIVSKFCPVSSSCSILFFHILFKLWFCPSEGYVNWKWFGSQTHSVMWFEAKLFFNKYTEKPSTHCSFCQLLSDGFIQATLAYCSWSSYISRGCFFKCTPPRDMKNHFVRNRLAWDSQHYSN